ncbi:MAG: tryptophanase [Sphingobacteriales bacterium]|nr:tryptophanase [Sphingobacteriales bacterium]
MRPLPYAEPYKIKMIENVYTSTREEREKWIKEAKYNLFKLKSNQVFIDLLTDSGTGAMSDLQWSEIMKGDESYAGASSFFKMKSVVSDITGFEYVLPTHQGRAAENVLFSALVREGDVVPGNSHFDTTKGHIELRKATCIDCTIDEAFDVNNLHPFKGNIDLDKLEKVLKTYPSNKIPFIAITVTCNTSGGQPVSMQNLKDVSALARKYGVRIMIDGARFTENAYFIKKREAGYEQAAIRDITREMFSYADFMTMSAKKDAIVNIGGFIAMNDEELYKKTCNLNIIYEGYITYGGLAGRDMNAIAQGLLEGTDFRYLEARIGQVEYLGKRLEEFGIAVQKPIGGHAVFVDALKFYPHIPQEEYPAQLMGVELYLESGVRAVEIGTLLADRDPITRMNRYPKLEFLRMAIPRRVYTNNHIEYVACALANVYERRNEIKHGFKIVYEAPLMRHFTVELERIKP